jgi:hypothetical protein
MIEKQLNRNFVIFHPSDFSSASEVAFGHALKIAMQSKAKLDIMHVETLLSPEKPYWLDFPSCASYSDAMGYLALRCSAVRGRCEVDRYYFFRS